MQKFFIIAENDSKKITFSALVVHQGEQLELFIVVSVEGSRVYICTLPPLPQCTPVDKYAHSKIHIIEMDHFQKGSLAPR